LKRTISKTVRFSTSSGSDEDDDFPIDMTLMGGKRWKSLTEFTQLKEIYRGRISLVASGVCKTSGESVVLKAYMKSKLNSSLKELIYREIRLHGRVRVMPGVAEFMGWFEDEVQIVIVQEHCTGGDLYRHLVLNGGQMTEVAAVQEVIHPLLQTMLRIHKYNICHRDLKPENLFFSEEGSGRSLKIGDFGLASDLSEMRERVGTLDYMAPEIILQRDESNFLPAADAAEGEQASPVPPYTLKVDVWAVGVITYELLVGRPPFEVSSQKQTAMLIVWGSPSFPEHLSAEARDFISLALRKDPSERPSMLDLLRHPFVTKNRRAARGEIGNQAKWFMSRSSFKEIALKQESAGLGDDRRALGEAPASPAGERDSPTAKKGSPGQHRQVGRSKSSRELPARQAHVPSPSFSSERDSPVANIRVDSAHSLTAAPSKAERAGTGGHKSEPRGKGPSRVKKIFFTIGRKSSRRASQRASDDSALESDSFSVPDALKPKAGKKSVRLSDSTETSFLVEPRRSRHREHATVTGILKKQESDAGVGPEQVELTVATSSPQTPAHPSSKCSTPMSGIKASIFRRFFSALVPFSSPSSPKTPTTPRAAAAAAAEPSPLPVTPDLREQRKQSSASAADSVDDAVSVTSDATAVTEGGSRRGSRRRPLRFMLGVSRLVSRFFDDPAPWNTGGAHLQGMGSLGERPGPEELESIQKASSPTRNRFFEYMLRRGGGGDAGAQDALDLDGPQAPAECAGDPPSQTATER